MLTPCLKGSVLDALIRTWIIDGMAELSMEICFSYRFKRLQVPAPVAAKIYFSSRCTQPYPKN